MWASWGRSLVVSHCPIDTLDKQASPNSVPFVASAAGGLVNRLLSEVRQMNEAAGNDPRFHQRNDRVPSNLATPISHAVLRGRAGA